MVKEVARRIGCAALVLVLTVAPASGLMCTMPCGEGAAPSCCCRNAAVGGEVAFTEPSCCSPNVSPQSTGSVTDHRVFTDTRSVLDSLAFSDTGETLVFSENVRPWMLPDSGAGAARSSPLFLLNSSLLI